MRTRFGPFTLVCLVIANMIGAGVFTTSGLLLAELGTPARVLACWLAGGIVACCGALSYGALVRRLTESGGEYLFLSRALHPAAGFVAGWISLLAGFTGAIAFAASALEAYALPAALRPAWLPEDAVAVGAIVLAGALHAGSASIGARAHNVLVVVKLALLSAIVVLALWALAARGLPAPEGGDAAAPFSWGAFALALVWISFSYSGFNAAVYVAGEARDARRNVPRALVAGTVIVTVLYVLLNALFVYGAPFASIAGREDVAARALGTLAGERMGVLVRIVVVLALASSVSSLILAGPRVYARMAEDGVLPRVFRLHGRAPVAAVGLQVALAVAVVVVSRLQELLSYLGFTLSVSAALTVSSLFVLRRREGARSVPVPGYPWVPGTFVAATLVFAAAASVHRPAEPVIGVATMAAGVLAWLCLARRRAS